MKQRETKKIVLSLTGEQRRSVRRVLGLETRALVFDVAACGVVKYGGPPITTEPPQGAIQLTEFQKHRVYAATGCRVDTLEFSRANVLRSAGVPLLLSLVAGLLLTDDS